MKFLFRYLGTAAAIILTAYIVPGISTGGSWLTILLAALVWSVMISIIKPVLWILTLPINILTFGLFSLVVNALLFWAMTLIVPGFVVADFLTALIGAFALSIFTWLIHSLF